MGRSPCCDKSKVKRGPWSPEEDALLKSFIHAHGTGGNWIAFPRKAGLNRCGKSCRLRWLNYLRPDIRHGGFSDHEDLLICSLYSAIGSRWSVIASKLPGRTDNDIKNYWNTKLKKKMLAGSSSGSEPVQPNQNELKPEAIAYDNGYNSQLGMNVVNSWDDMAPAQQTWDPQRDFFHGQHETSRQLELPPSSSTCSSNVGGENDMDDFWLRMLVDQSSFFGGEHTHQQAHSEMKSIEGFHSVLDHPAYPSFY